MSLNYEIKQLNHVALFLLKGRIIAMEDIEALQNEVENLLSAKQLNIVLDLTELNHINSSGINFIMRTLTKTRIQNGDMVLCGISGNIENIFNVTKLNKVYTIYASSQEAMDHFKQ